MTPLDMAKIALREPGMDRFYYESMAKYIIAFSVALDKAPTVYLTDNQEFGFFSEHKAIDSTHTGKLICIEELKK